MDCVNVDSLVQQLAVGFEALQEEYKKLYSQQTSLEKKLANAHEQYNELAKLYGVGPRTTPPLSLASAPEQHKEELVSTVSIPAVLEKSADESSRSAAGTVRLAAHAASRLKAGLPAQFEGSSQGVRIWAGPSADKPETANSNMPSISESPFEQDFTIEGKPSVLGCPFASMQRKKKLSSHAASVLSRYNHTSSADAASARLSATSRINGKDSLSRRSSRRASFADPIKAEICGLSDHHAETSPVDIPVVEEAVADGNAESGVCPIRFLDQHSPEEVATYFEKHKHELPRSHEVCVMRYQSNEEQIRELDAKYGNLVSMIKGLGEKHKPMLPAEPEDHEEEEDVTASDDKVRRWASSVSAQAPEAELPQTEPVLEEDRQSHFERPLRDIRVGESPSRPWGISVPAKYLENVRSEASSKPAPPSPGLGTHANETRKVVPAGPAQSPKKCPFAHSAGPLPPGHAPVQAADAPVKEASSPDIAPATKEPQIEPQQPEPTTNADPERKMVFTGPVFFGFGAEDVAKILRDSGLCQSSR